MPINHSEFIRPSSLTCIDDEDIEEIFGGLSETMSRHEVLDRILQWEGIIGFTNFILAVIADIEAAKTERKL